MPATLRQQRSSSHPCRQPPKKMMLHVFESYVTEQSSREPGMGDPPLVSTVHFRGSTSPRQYSTSVLLCACSYDGGASTTLTYQLPQPPTCDMAYCMESDVSPPPPPPLPPPDSRFVHRDCPRSLDEVLVLDDPWRSADWKRYVHYTSSRSARRVATCVRSGSGQPSEDSAHVPFSFPRPAPAGATA